MSLRTGAPLYPMFCVWDELNRRYRMVRGAVVESVSTGDQKNDIIRITAAYTAEIEKIIRQFPDQWIWIHKRWKTRPPGENELY